MRNLKTIAALCAGAMILASCGGRKATAPKDPFDPGPTQRIHLIWNVPENKWKVKLNNGPEQDPSTAKTTLGKDVGPTTFVVDIAGKTAAFKSPGGLTVWETSKSQPPGSAQISGPVLTKSGKLVFSDVNKGDPVTIYYGLNLTDGTVIDPIIENGGGNDL